MPRTDPGVGGTFLRLGLTSFGGPVAHLGFFRTELVARRGWLRDAQFADLVALGQFLPGPASSQVGIGVGLLRAGLPGSLRAWLGFTLPSATLMIAAGVALGGGLQVPAGALAGLKVAAVAVVAQAVLMMARMLCRGWIRVAIAGATGAAVLLVPAIWMPSAALAVAGLAGVLLLRQPPAGDGPGTRGPEDGPDSPPGDAGRRPLPRWLTPAALSAFVVLLVGLPVLARAWPGEWLTLIAGFYRAGALVFGGGHVVLPMLEDVAVGSAAVTQADFLAGYGLANALPGPLFTFAGFLGAAAGGVWLGVVSVVAVFLPGYLLVVGALGSWHRARRNPAVRSALAGVNAAVVGLLGAALYDPVILAGITDWRTAALALLAFGALVGLRVAPHLVVLGCAVLGWVALA